MKTLVLTAMSAVVFTATSVADIVPAEKLAVTSVQTQIPVSSAPKDNGVPWWLVVGIMFWLIIDLTTETSRYRETDD